MKKGETPLDGATCEGLLQQLHSDWQLENEGAGLVRNFRFSDFHHTMAFVNALAWVAHQQDHHPDLEVGYNRCVVHYSTHSIGGVSLNDFICAAKIDAL